MNEEVRESCQHPVPPSAQLVKVVYYYRTASEPFYNNNHHHQHQDNNNENNKELMNHTAEVVFNNEEEEEAMTPRSNHHNNSNNNKKINNNNKPQRIGSPTLIGFLAFGFTTLLYNIHNADIVPLDTTTVGMVLCYGGLVQFIAGFLELINYNVHGCTISTTYGAFWMATAAAVYIDPINADIKTAELNYMGGFFFLWFIFAATLFLCSFKSPLVCMALMFSVALNFLLQSIGFFLVFNRHEESGRRTARVAGYEGIVVGSIATYIGLAMSFEEVYGRRYLPLFSHEGFRNFKW